jgi:hypothetical protein
MPKGNVLFKQRTTTRAVRALQKAGLKVKAASFAPDGTMTLSIAEPVLPKVNLPELDGEIETFVESTWDRDYGKPAA